jgi:hypothetical protein
MWVFEESMSYLTDAEIEHRLEEVTFTIALETTHFHTFSDHRRAHLQKDLLVNKQRLQALREERERRIIAGRYKPY